MIDVRTLVHYYEMDSDIEITCTDGQLIVGDIVSVDDEEESGLDEIGCSLFTPEGAFIGVGISEIQSIRAVTS